ncbi:unnamed protein product [Orchesella dallaii]|uniref:Claspin n=1 Tax=Orchesella dallaii TaxID=48710 RepID=A0ABP1QFX7_9HEXA
MPDQLNEGINMTEEEPDHISTNDTEEMDTAAADSPIKLNNSKTARRRAVVDSDSESDTGGGNDGGKNVDTEDIDTKSDGELHDEVGLPSSSGKTKRIIMSEDSDSDSAQSSKSDKIRGKVHKKSDDEQSSSSSDSSNASSRTGKHNKKSDASEDDELPDIPNPSFTARPSNTFENLIKNSDVYGADSSSEEDERRRYSKAGDSDNKNTYSDNESKSRTKKKKSSKSKDKRPPMRKASEKAREKTVQELASITQKMTRESRVSLPYSKPKQLTLDEFLKQRKEAKKSILPTIISSPALGTLRNGISLDNDTEDVIPCSPTDNVCVGKELKVELEPKAVSATPENKVEDDIEIGDSENNLSTPIELAAKDEDILAIEEITPELVSAHQLPEVSDAKLPTSIIDSTSAATTNILSEADTANVEPCNTKEILDAIDVAEVVQEHQEKEAELEAYLESMKPKPKRKSIKEMIMALPGYKDLADLKPQIGGGDKDVISLDNIHRSNGKTSKDLKHQQKIEQLKDRYVRHCITAPTKPVKGEHIKLKIKKKEEDSQGIEHLVEGEVEYVRNPLNEDDEALDFLGDPQSSSPQAVAPGAQRRRIQNILLDKIRQQKLKDMEERRKVYAMYNDEIDVDEKDCNEDEEEILNEDEMSDEEGESDLGEEEEEEELEDLLSSTTKKKKKKSQFVDDEAEDDEDVADDENEEDEDTGSSDDDDDDVNMDNDENDPNKYDDAASVGISDDSLPAAQISTNIDETDLASNPDQNDDSENILSVDCTPKVTTAVLNHRTPSDFWIPSRTNVSSRHSDELSPLIPRLNKTESDDHRSESMRAPESLVPVSLANVISERESKFDDLVDLCSGRFVSQINNNTSESQEDNEFGGFDFADDDGHCNKDSEKAIGTPVTKVSKMAVDGITPKLSEKIQKTKLLMQFEQEAEVSKIVVTKTSNGTEDNISDNEEDEEDVITTRIHVRKQRRLQFSDDEDDVDDQEPVNSGPEKEEASENEESEAVQSIATEAPKAGLFFNKDGRMKRKFVEDEAELSGSEEGSDDEDERGLNHYEMEEGDDEEFDLDVVRNQAERAHLKHLLDDDDRNIRYLQEKYLESGDLNVDRQRERRFKWLNMSAINDDANMGDSDEEHNEETPEETSQKLAYLEKRKWLSENSHLLEPGDESQSLFSNSRFVHLGKGTLRRIESCVESSTSESRDVFVKDVSNQKRSIYDEIIKAKAAAKAANVLTSFSEGITLEPLQPNQSTKSMSQPFLEGTSSEQQPKFPAIKKGSFLSRGGVMLAKLAEITKSGDPVSNVKSNSRNFVFSHITPPNVEKTDGSTSKVKRGATKAGKNNATVQSKKIKVDRCFNNLDEASKEASIFKWL